MVSRTEEVRPPIIAAPSEYIARPRRELKRHGGEPDDGGKRSHQDRPQAHAAGSNHRIGRRQAIPFSCGEVDDQNTVGIGNSDQHQHATSDITFSVVCVRGRMISTPMNPMGSPA